MDDLEGFSTNKSPVFDETIYAFWSIRMQTYLMDVGMDIWELVVIGYIAPRTPPTNAVGKKSSENDEKSMNAILCSLSKFEFVKVMHCKSTK